MGKLTLEYWKLRETRFLTDVCRQHVTDSGYPREPGGTRERAITIEHENK